MIEVRRTADFDGWLHGLRDDLGRVRILRRIERVVDGNLGDASPVGEGIFEMRLFFGPGYRVYFTQRGGAIVILLCGGDKGSQNRDIACAKALAKEIE